MKNSNFGRRQFLRGAGGFALAIPLLPSLLPKAEAQTVPTKRFLAIHNGHSQAVEQWYPDHSKLSWSQNQATSREVSLASIQGSISPIIGSAFDPLRSKLNLLSKLDLAVGGKTYPSHNAETILAGGCINDIRSTVDQVIARHLTGTSSLNLTTRSPVAGEDYQGYSDVSVNNGAYAVGQFNPSAVFDSMFGNATPAPSAEPNKSGLIVDRVFAQYEKLRRSPRLSKKDGERLDQHISSLHDLQKSIQANSTTPAMACSTTSGPRFSPVRSGNVADYSIVLDHMFKLLEIGMKCGKIRAATLMLHTYGYFAGDLNFIPGIRAGLRFHEDLGHGSERGMKLALNQFYANKIAAFLRSLDEPEYGQATYLDNSLVMWANDFGALANTGDHVSQNMPVLLAGSAGGFLKTGKYVEYGVDLKAGRAVAGDERNFYQKGRPYNQLLVTILQAMGLRPDQYETGGEQGFGVYGSDVSYFDYLGGNHRRDLLPMIV